MSTNRIDEIRFLIKHTQTTKEEIAEDCQERLTKCDERLISLRVELQQELDKESEQLYPRLYRCNNPHCS